MNDKTKKERKTLQEQHDEYLLDLDPNTTDEKIGHTSAPFASSEEITDTSDQLASQKSFIPDEAKQYSKIKQNDNLEGNKPIEGEEEKYRADPNKDILNIGEARNKLRYGEKLPSGAQLSKSFKEIKFLMAALSAKLNLAAKSEASMDLDHLSGMLSAIEQRVEESKDNNLDNLLEELLKK